MQIKNSEIRSRAWELCKKNYGKILVVTLIVSLISMLAASLSSWIAMLILLIFSPVVEMGMIRFSQNLWHGQPAGVSDLFAYMDHLLRIWGIQLLCSLAQFGITLLSSLLTTAISAVSILGGGTTASPSAGVSIVYIVLIIVLAILSIWLSLRLSLASTAFVLNPELPAMECIRNSWNSTRGNVMRIFCNSLCVSLPLIIATALISLLLGTSGVLALVLDLIFSTLFQGYIYIGEYGLAEYLLTGYVRLEAIS